MVSVKIKSTYRSYNHIINCFNSNIKKNLGITKCILSVVYE